MNYEAKLKAAKAEALATLAAHGVHLPSSVDAVVLHNAALAVIALVNQTARERITNAELVIERDNIARQRDELAAVLRKAEAFCPVHIQDEIRATLAKVRS